MRPLEDISSDLMREEINGEKDPEKRKRLENALRLGIGYLDKKM